jgi:hypothetical protein
MHTWSSDWKRVVIFIVIIVVVVTVIIREIHGDRYIAKARHLRSWARTGRHMTRRFQPPRADAMRGLQPGAHLQIQQKVVLF